MCIAIMGLPLEGHLPYKGYSRGIPGCDLLDDLLTPLC